ncbi:MAG: hypothetical protein GY774_39865 [Planctomycetes bacterium]|nr:hypothetical protein [Planctomycetota bacterium]
MEIDKYIRKEPLVVTSKEHLIELIDLMHDEYFNLDDIKYIKDQQLVEIPYRRQFHDGPCRIIRNIFGIKRIEVELIRSLLIIRNVKDYYYNDKARIGTYSFNTIEYKSNNLQIICCEDLELNMVVSGIEIESHDIEVKGKTRLTKGWFWESYTGQFY